MTEAVENPESGGDLILAVDEQEQDRISERLNEKKTDRIDPSFAEEQRQS